MGIYCKIGCNFWIHSGCKEKASRDLKLKCFRRGKHEKQAAKKDRFTHRQKQKAGCLHNQKSFFEVSKSQKGDGNNEHMMYQRLTAQAHTHTQDDGSAVLILDEKNSIRRDEEDASSLIRSFHLHLQPPAIYLETGVLLWYYQKAFSQHFQHQTSYIAVKVVSIVIITIVSFQGWSLCKRTHEVTTPLMQHWCITKSRSLCLKSSCFQITWLLNCGHCPACRHPHNLLCHKSHGKSTWAPESHACNDVSSLHSSGAMCSAQMPCTCWGLHLLF